MVCKHDFHAPGEALRRGCGGSDGHDHHEPMAGELGKTKAYFAEAYASMAPDARTITWGANDLGRDNVSLREVVLPEGWNPLLKTAPE